jgi:proteasome lid subunit RPN8/RPN11
MSASEVLIAESAVASMRHAATAAYPNETGGILLGVLADNAPWVVLADELVDSVRGRNHFRIAAGATSDAVSRAQQADPRIGYLGDWHSHPANVGPSRTDLQTLQRYATVQRGGPATTLIVLRREHDQWELDPRRVFRWRTVTCSIHLTGDLPPACWTALEDHDA